MNDKDKLQICWQAFSMENSLLQTYRVLFMMVEAALLALAYVLKGPWVWVGAAFGWSVVGIWIRTCEAKGGDVDRWMEQIRGFQSVVGKGWFDYLKPGVKWSGGRIARILFNKVIPILIAVLWGLVVVLL